MQASRCKYSIIQTLLLVCGASFPRKQIRTKLMLCNPLLIIHERVKGFLKVILQYKNEASQLQKWAWHMHNDIVAINAQFSFSADPIVQ